MIQITLIGQEGCELCAHAHSILERLARHYPIELRLVDLAKPEGRGFERGGIMFPPGLFVGDKPFSYGRLSERRLRRELDSLLRTKL
jgi:hypothetical protein